MIFGYTPDGLRVPFDPESVRATCCACCLCGQRRVTTIGVFVPATDPMRGVVLMLRRQAPRAGSTSCIAYGLCHRCAKYPDVGDRVEAALVAEAGRVTVQ